MKFYPRASENRRDPHDPDVRPRRMAFLREAISNFLILQVLFLCLFAYIFGSLFEQAGHTHNVNMLFVDYDGGAVGSALRDAYSELQSDTFPSLTEGSPLQVPVSELKDEVCSIRYWAAIFTSPGASNRLAGALEGGAAAANYDPTNAITLIWNQARYATIADAVVLNNIQMLSQAARRIYLTANTSAVIRSANVNDAAALSILADPWKLNQMNIQPTAQGSRLIYNTLVIILIMIQEFFYLGTVNGLYVRFNLFGTIRARRIIIYRGGISIAYTFIGTLCVTGMIWAFRAGWQVNSNQFALTWMVLWLFAHLNFLVLDVYTVWLPAPYVPMALITWIVTNVTSILLPFQLNPGFYRWAYALPAHSVFQALVDIWSGGCNPRLHVSLPVLFAWWVVGLAGSAVGVFRRCHYAVLADEAQEAAFQHRLKTALLFERKRVQEAKDGKKDLDMSSIEPLPTEEEIKAKQEEKQLESVIREEDLRTQETKSAARRTENFSFTLPIGRGEWRSGAPLTRQTTAPPGIS